MYSYNEIVGFCLLHIQNLEASFETLHRILAGSRPVLMDGKADEHWDYGTVAGQGNPADCARPGAPAGGAAPARGAGGPPAGGGQRQ